MTQDRRYEHALSAALVILNELEKAPDMEKRARLALAVFSILSAMEAWEEERGAAYASFSAN